MTSQPDHSLADEPMVDEPLPDQSGPAATVSPEPVSPEPVSPEPVMPQPLPGEPLPPEPLAEAVESPGPGDDAEQASATTGRPFGNGLPAPVVIGRHAERVRSAAIAEDTEPDLTEPDGTEPDMRTTAASVAPGRLSGQWHDIQAMFVDDPQGSVQRAAQVVDAAVAGLAESLRQRQDALVHEDSWNTARNTEQLREALVDFREFYQRLSALAEHLATE